jgi:glycosyltransferase involved in cell wall biosynthesis
MTEDSSNAQVSVIIPTFNRCAGIRGAIEPLLSDPATGEVVVVVDGSHDESFDLLTSWSAEEPRIRPLFQENSGPTIARQKGIHAARFPIVVLLDDDVIAGEGLISGHAQWHQQRANRLVLGYMPTRVPTKRMPGQAPTILYAQDYESMCEFYESRSDQIVRNLWMGNISLRTDVARTLGPGIANALEYHEDIRFGLQCEAQGMEAIFDRSLAASHLHNRNLRRFFVDSQRSGVGKARLCLEFPELAPQLNPFETLSDYERLIIAVLAKPYIRPVSVPLAMATSNLTGRLRLWGLEVFAARVLRQIEMYRGFHAEIRAGAPPKV